MDFRERRKRQDIIKWLNTEVTDTKIIFDCILDILDDIVGEIKNNNFLQQV